MALISLSDWIDRYGDEPEVETDDDVPSNLTYRVALDRAEPVADYRINAVRPSGSEIAGTRTRLL